MQLKCACGFEFFYAPAPLESRMNALLTAHAEECADRVEGSALRSLMSDEIAQLGLSPGRTWLTDDDTKNGQKSPFRIEPSR